MMRRRGLRNRSLKHVWLCGCRKEQQRYRCRWCGEWYWECPDCHDHAARYGQPDMCAECYFQRRDKQRQPPRVFYSPVGEEFSV